MPPPRTPEQAVKNMRTWPIPNGKKGSRGSSHKAELQQLLARYGEEDHLIIVEGNEDKNSLNRLGLANIMVLNKKPLFKIVEDIIKEKQKVLIMTDLDKKGKELYGKLNHHLQQHGVKVDNTLRNFLFKNTQLRQIEGMWRYLTR